MRAGIRRHWRGLSALAVIGALALAFGLYWFAPWKLFTDDTVNEALPAAAVTALTSTAPVPAVSPSAEPTVSESPIPTPTPSPSPTSAAPAERLLSSGSLISHEHATHGTVSVVQSADGSRWLALANLDTSNGPDLRVWLATAPVKPGHDNWYIFDDPQYRHVSLGALKGNLGNQVYAIPSDADLASLTSVTIWCDRFDVSFGAAALAPA